MTIEIKETDIETKSLTFRVRVAGVDAGGDAEDWLNGDDNLALCLHGFPDDAGTFDGLAERLVESGYRVVAPYMRGNGATERPPLEAQNYSALALSTDVAALLEALGATEPLIIGHDWGAVAVSTFSAFDPEAVGRAVVMAVPPNFVPRLDIHGAQAFRSWYMGLFQAPGLAEDAVRRGDFALVERLWSLWSPNWKYPAERLESVKRTLSQDSTVKAALLYYRSFFDRALTRPAASAHVRGIEVPTLVLGGCKDGCIGIDIFENVEEYYDGPVEVQRLPDVGHFMHYEALDDVATLILNHAK